MLLCILIFAVLPKVSQLPGCRDLLKSMRNLDFLDVDQLCLHSVEAFLCAHESTLDGNLHRLLFNLLLLFLIKLHVWESGKNLGLESFLLLLADSVIPEKMGRKGDYIILLCRRDILGKSILLNQVPSENLDLALVSEPIHEDSF